MSENFEKRHSAWEAEKRTIEQLITTAQEEAPTEDEADAYQEQLNQATARYIAGNTTLEQFNAETAAIIIPPGAVLFDTLPEYRFGMECAEFTPEEIENTLAHENSHMVEAFNGIPGARLTYQLQFMRTAEGMTIVPSVHFEWPDKIADEADHRLKLREAIEAPDYLSDGDKKMLGE